MKKIKKILCITLALSLAAIPAWLSGRIALEAVADEDPKTIGNSASQVLSAEPSGVSGTVDFDGATYIIADASGRTEKVIESSGTGMTYPDITSSELPVSFTVRYTLDGAVITPEELAGKSGHICIRFECENLSRQLVKVNGTAEKLCTPYAVLTGLMLDRDRFAGVEISGGRAIDDGKHIIAAGLILPGMADSLDPEGRSELVSKLPSFMEISADVTDFALDGAYGVILPLNTEELDIEGIDELKDLEDQMDKLSDGMKDLRSGASALSSGAKDLSDGAAQLGDGTKKLAEGTDRLAGGTDALADGASALSKGIDRLEGGVGELSTGLSLLTENSGLLRSGADQIFETMLGTVSDSLAAAGLPAGALTPENYSEKLSSIISSLDKDAVYAQALGTVTAAVEANRQAVAEAVTGAIRAQVREAVISAAGFPSADAYQQLLDAGQIPDAVAQGIENGINAQMSSDEISAAIASQTDSQIQALIAQQMESDEVKARIAAAGEGLAKVSTAKAQLDSLAAFCSGVNEYTRGVDSAAAGAGQLSDGVKALKEGSSTLSSGAGELSGGVKTVNKGSHDLADGAAALTDGAVRLADGAAKLSDGINRLDEDGISRITDRFGGENARIAARFAQLIELGRETSDTHYVIRFAGIK